LDDAALIRILTTRPGENHEQANARKERELGTMFARMSVVESRGMSLRMSRLREGDSLSEAFDRLPMSTRERLLAFLTDERRLRAIAARAS
jgi:hypothetical protein